MSSLFNSLGSNYSADFCQLSRTVLSAPHKWQTGSETSKLKTILKQGFKTNRITLTYKGRQAISIALLSYGIGPGHKVLIQAFTCWAVEQAIRDIGAQPVFVDVGKNSLNPTPAKIKQKLSDPDIKAVILQHTLGFGSDAAAIKQLAVEHKLVLIEDLAHSYGAKAVNGKLLGNYAHATCLSFGRDKAIDGVSGGAVIFRIKPKKQIKVAGKLNLLSSGRDLIYPSVTQAIRNWYSFGLGKIFHFLSIKTHLILGSPTVTNLSALTTLPNSHAKLAIQSHSELNFNLKHRRFIGFTYDQEIDKKFKLKNLNLSRSACLRYPIIVSNRKELLNIFKSHGFHLSDTWYQSPVDVGGSTDKSLYIPGSCPNSEHLAKYIINLPTHRHTSPLQANQIAYLINQHAQNVTPA